MSSYGSDRSGDRDMSDAGDVRDDGDASDGLPSGGAQDGDVWDEDAGAEHGLRELGLLAEMAALRRQARADRHAYWFPLVLFGLIAAGSFPFYFADWPPLAGTHRLPPMPLSVLGRMSPQSAAYLDYYWLAALLGGLLVTGLWYRWQARRAGLTMPHRAYLITAASLTLAAIVIPPLSQFSWLRGLADLLPADLTIRGTFPLLLIGLGLLVLARTERSWGLGAIAVVYCLAALLGSLYDEANILYDIGWQLPWTASPLPNVLLPAAILLISGIAALAAGRRPRATARQRLASTGGAT